MAEPLSDAYLLEAEQAARRFQGAYTGTSGTLAAHVMRLLAELSRVKGQLAVERSRKPGWTAAEVVDRFGQPGPGPSEAKVLQWMQQQKQIHGM